MIFIEKRKKAKKLRALGWSVRKIARYLVSGENNVRRWLNMKDEEVKKDGRGWPKGKLRKHNFEEKRRILEIRDQLEREGLAIGSQVIKTKYTEKFGEDMPQWFINMTLKEGGRIKNSYALEADANIYRHYPGKKLKRLGRIAMDIRFVKQKSSDDPDGYVNFLSCRYIRPHRFAILYHISRCTGDEVIRILKMIWENHPIPDVLRIGHDFAFGANLSRPRRIGNFTLFLLNLGIKPVYVSSPDPRHQWAAKDSVIIFLKRCCRELNVGLSHEIDIRIKKFHLEYHEHSTSIDDIKSVENPILRTALKCMSLKNRDVKLLLERNIYFIQAVRRKKEKGHRNECGCIKILGVDIRLDPGLIDCYVFCQLNLNTGKLTVYVESEGGSEKMKVIKRANFTVENINGA